MVPGQAKLRQNALRDAFKIIRKAPGTWLTIGVMLALSWVIPKALLWMLTGINGDSDGYASYLDFAITERIRPILAATTWSCLAGAFRMAHLHVRGTKPGAGDFIGGFFGGFLLLLPAIVWEFILPDRVILHEAAVFLLLPLWPVGSAFLVAMGAKTPMLQCFRMAGRLLEGRYWQWLGYETACAGIMIAGTLVFGIGLPIALALRVLTLSLAVREILPALSESSSAPTP